jgi:hypothetical protein
MTSPEELRPPLATAEQASAVLNEVNDLTTLYATRPNTYEFEASGAPAAVGAHFPPHGPTSTGEVTSVTVSKAHDAQTGKPAQEGLAALVTFTHRDIHYDAGVTYVTQVNYTINTGVAGAIQPMERHVTNYDTGPHKTAAEALSRWARHLIEGPEAEQARYDQAFAAERSAGLGDVTATEADQIFRFLEDLKLSAAHAVNPEIMATLRSADIEPRSVSLDRRLIDYRTTATHEVAEVFSKSFQRRLIVAKAGNQNIAVSKTLEEQGVPILQPSDIQVEGLHMWDVPAGSSPLRSIMLGALRNPDRYGDVLTMAQDVLQKIDDSGFVVTTTANRGLMDHLIIVPDTQTGYRVVLVPPIQLSTEINQPAGSVETFKYEVVQFGLSKMLYGDNPQGTM